MTAVDHAELKRVAEGATPGPWTYRDMRPNTYGPAFVDASDVQSLAICGDAVGRSNTHGFCLQVDADVRMANAAFIAAANPAVVLSLLDALAAAEADKYSEDAIERAEANEHIWFDIANEREARALAAERDRDALQARLDEAEGLLKRAGRYDHNRLSEFNALVLDIRTFLASKETNNG